MMVFLRVIYLGNFFFTFTFTSFFISKFFDLLSILLNLSFDEIITNFKEKKFHNLTWISHRVLQDHLF